MTTPVNALGQPIGAALPGWIPPPLPSRDPMDGRYVRVEPVDERFAADLHAANLHDVDGRNWTYLPYGPFAHEADYRNWMAATCFGADPMFHVFVDRATGHAMGLAAYMRIAPASGAIEVGHVALLAAAAARPRRDRSDVLDDAAGVRARVPPLRVEVRRPQRALARSCRAPRILLRGHLPAGDGIQGQKSGHGVVLGDRFRVAGAGARVRSLAWSGEFRRGGTAAIEAERPDTAPPGKSSVTHSQSRFSTRPGRAALSGPPAFPGTTFVVRSAMNHRRPPRIQGFGYVGPRIYFLTVCTFRRSRWFEREDCASRTISALMRTSKDYGFALLTSCLMPDHLHCLVEGLRADSDCVKWIAMFKQRSVSVTPATMASGYGKRVFRARASIRR